MLSKRLDACYGLIWPDTARLIDVGCDHGHLSAAFLLDHPQAKALLIDRREGPLAKAALNLGSYVRSGRATLSLSDGLTAWKPETADTIVIAGVGGLEILAILRRVAEQGNVKDDYPLRLVWQAMRDAALVRESFRLAGVEADKQVLCEDRGWVYSVDRQVLGRQALEALLRVESTGGEVEDWLGPALVGGVAPAALAERYVKRQGKIAAAEIAGMSGEAKRKREQLLAEIEGFAGRG